MTNRQYEYSLLVLRVTLGVIFLAHGLQKISQLDGVIQFFVSLGMPPFAAYAVAATETIGGAMLLTSFFPRIAAIAISLVMLGAIFTTKLDKGLLNGYEYELMLLSAAVAVGLSGSRIFSLGAALQTKKQPEQKQF
ncbi:DoxX family protein [Propionispora hippei]|uniref:Uncharacterized membrane protein YphA, DoxX/SURF4 family n=1 Tax=Propionispora hippei DSM 15287 TaxID=1123003 RepID=A0A1M6L8M0_9FIRM|nr:DoxX family protein [Propionispora hippei]SHJ67547.1 Uncharacterized membrane protein YphA, DoxX/SURF4 family [Propionispora hippei DSM 15287]